MEDPQDSNFLLHQPVQIGRLFSAMGWASAAVIFLTPLFVSVFDSSPRRTSVTILRFTALFFLAFTAGRKKDGLLEEARLKTVGRPLRIWFRGFLLGAIPLTLYVIILTLCGERRFDGILQPGTFAWQVVKYLPLAFVIGFLEDMLFFGFLATVFGGRMQPCIVIYAFAHFLSPSKDFPWLGPIWTKGLEAFRAMGESLCASFQRPLEIIGLMLVGLVLASVARRERNIWLAMGIHGGWYYVRVISRKFGENEAGQLDWLIGTDRFYDGVLGWLAILSTGVYLMLSARRKESSPQRAS